MRFTQSGSGADGLFERGGWSGGGLYEVRHLESQGRAKSSG